MPLLDQLSSDCNWFGLGYGPGCPRGFFCVQPRLSAAVLGDIWDLRGSVNHSLGFCGL